MDKLILALAIMTTVVATTTVVAVQTPLAFAQGKGPPLVHIGNPHDFQPGPPIPSCTAIPPPFGQGNNPQAGGCKFLP